MVVLGAAIAVPALTAGTNAVVGAVIAAGVYAAAGYLDAKYVMPGLLGKGKAQAQPPRLLGVPVGSNEPGAPRAWAIGRRIRVPTHIIWQAEKVRESSASSSKGGSLQQRRVLVTAAVAFNDRVTKRLVRLVGNDVLIIGGDRNLVQVDSDAMSASESGGVVTFTMASLEDPDFADRFGVGDNIQCSGFVVTAGGSVNVGQLEILTVTAHGSSTPSTMTARACTGQSMSGLVATGGTPSSPASIERVDDMLIDGSIEGTPAVLGTGVVTGYSFELSKDPSNVFAPGDIVRLAGFEDSATSTDLDFSTARFSVTSSSDAGGGVFFMSVSLISGPAFNATIVSRSVTTDQGRISFDNPPPVSPGLFPSGYDPEEFYHDGSEDQLPDALMEANIGVGDVSAYRGMAYQILDEFAATQFGDSLPFQLEAVIDVDEGMTWQEALILCTERGGVAREFVDTFGVTPRPFEGFFMRGAVTGVTNLFPLLIAGQITTQERDGVICFQDTDAADVVQIQNGAQFSDLGAYVGDREQGDTKLRFTHGAREDLPTSIGIRHQDPDNAYADGYQHFGLRNPTGVDHENRQEIDLSNLVLTRKQARNLATTVMRRAWVNGTIVEKTLPAAYLDLLEGDLITVTDDEGNDHTARIIQRDMGTNFLVKVTAAIEELDLAVTGSPVQSAAGVAPSLLITPPLLTPTILDIPPLTDADGLSPGLLLTVAANAGSSFAGATVFMSSDNELSWSQVGIIATQGSTGTLTVALAAGTPAETYGSSTLTYDVGGTLYVEFDNAASLAAQYLIAQSNAYVEAGGNLFAIIDPDGTVEILAARDVVPLSATSFLLATMLRGLRGTWAAAATVHPVGARIVMLDWFRYAQSGMFLPLTGTTSSTTPLHFRFVPPGRDLADVQSVSIVPTWRNASPFDPRVLTKTIGGSPFDARFTTENWTRTNQPYGTLAPYPMDETVEAYRFTFWDPTGSTIKRTKTISAAGTGAAMLRDTWVDYTAAEQTADGYTPSGSTSFWVSVQQLGTYGDSRLVKRLV